MSYPAMNPLRYEAAQPQPIYPPFLRTSAGHPAGQAAFPPAEPAQPTMLPGFVAAQPTPSVRSVHTPARHPAPQTAQQPRAQQQTPQAYPPPAQQMQMQMQMQRGQQAPHLQQAAQPGYGTVDHAPYGHPATPSNLAAHQQAYAAYHQQQAAQQAQQAAQQSGAHAPFGSQQAPGLGGRMSRPRILTAAVASGLLAAGLTAASQVLALRDGKAAVTSAVAGRLPGDDPLFTSLIAPAVDQAYKTIEARAYLSIGLAVVVAVLVLICLRAGLVARIAAVAGLAVTALLLMVCLIDVFPTSGRMVGAPAMALFPVTAALLFMPAVGRYRTSRRLRRA